ncbi:MAG TPA: hypothetical protein VEY30_13520 [Myxococcaceae bacterium]|nr:hypothetical protein [Myxococcaceae bacterium]
MLVYGDREQRENPSAVIDALLSRTRALADLSPGLTRHAELAGLLIEAGRLAQGLIDWEVALRGGQDEVTELSSAALLPAMNFARALWASYRSGFNPSGGEGFVKGLSALNALRILKLPETVTLKEPEGYAFYALYPEAYMEASITTRGSLGDHLEVVGLRSIGTGLACAVAIALGSDRLPVTLRPGGHPFQRTLSLGPALNARLTKGAPTLRLAVVDEGPGMSGSSFGSVADLVEDAGVPGEQVHFFPSHRGDLGPPASERHRRRWSRASKHVVDFEPLFVVPRGRAPTLSAWAEDVTGPPMAPLEDVAGGGWRRHLFTSEAEWPAVHPHWERRKYLLHSESGTWLFKFSGLGAVGERKWRRAQALGGAGLIPPASALRHGFLVQPWLREARPLTRCADFSRPEFIKRCAQYLAFRATRLATPGAGGGASPQGLFEMARFNVGKALGECDAAALDRFAPELDRYGSWIRPVETDNRMHAWEWLRLPDGRWLKADALDHCETHDLVGTQDVAWDIAGASVELALSDDEETELAGRIARLVDQADRPRLRTFYKAAYLAFQLGFHHLAADSVAGSEAVEAARLRARAEGYGQQLQRFLAKLA